VLPVITVPPSENILLVDASSYITFTEAGAESLLYDRNETIWVPEHVTYEVSKEPAKTELYRAIHSGDVYVDSTDEFNTHLSYFKAASFHLDEKTPYQFGEFLWSGDSAFIGRGLSMEKIVIVTDDGFVRDKCKNLNLEYTGSLGILLDGMKKDIAHSDELIRYLDSIARG